MGATFSLKIKHRKRVPADALNFLDPLPMAASFNLTPAQALDYFSSKGLKPTFSYLDMMGEEHDYAFTVAGMMDADLLHDVRKAVDSAIASGQSMRDFEKELTPLLQKKGWWGDKELLDPITGLPTPKQLGSPHRLELIFRTNLMNSYAAGQWEQIQRQKEIAPYLMYDAVDDGKTREAHAKWDGKVLPVDSPFWKTHYPPNGYNCFLPETQIEGDLTSAMRQFYTGKACQITTRSGRSVRVTANHPILTQRGWIAACRLEKGDQLVSYDRPVDNRIKAGEVDNHQGITSAENLFKTITAEGARLTPSPALKLNSNTTNRKINIVAADGCLPVEVNTRSGTRIEQFILERGNDRATARQGTSTRPPFGRGFSAGNAVLSEDASNIAASAADYTRDAASPKFGVGIEIENSGLDTLITTVSRSPGSSALPLNATRCLFDNLPLEALGLGAGTDHNAMFDQLATDGIAADAGLFGYLIDRHPGQVFSDPVIEVREFDFCGHVYDFQASEAIVSANGIIAHNCRCGVIQLDQDDLDEMGITPSAEPKLKMQPWTNPRTGKPGIVHEGLDPGWNKNPGAARVEQMKQHQAEKLMLFPPDMVAAIKKAQPAIEAMRRELLDGVKADPPSVPTPPPAAATTAHTLTSDPDPDTYQALGADTLDRIQTQAMPDGTPIYQAIDRELSAERPNWDHRKEIVLTFQYKLFQELRKVRPMHLEAKVDSKGKGAKAVKRASTRYPDDWVKAANEYGPLYVRYSRGRGWAWSNNGPEGITVKLGGGFGKVTLEHPRVGYIITDESSTAEHEYAHRLQKALPGLDRVFNLEHERRTAQDPLRRLKDIYPGSRYNPTEVAKEDGYYSAYMGKEYAVFGDEHKAAEVMTMALQPLVGENVEGERFGNTARFFQLYETDPRMLQIALGLLFHYQEPGQ